VNSYNARDLARVPSLLSLARVPLAAAFPFFVAKPAAAIAILVAAGASDILDGWYARRYRQVTAIGAVVDPITDKIFVATVALTLVLSGTLSLPLALLLGTRDVGELPLVTWLALDKHARHRLPQNASNVLGKAATALQFATVVGVIAGIHGTYAFAAALLTGLMGIAAALGYWMTTLSQIRSANA
jgi:phosphatidylglycerophosphate synthase